MRLRTNLRPGRPGGGYMLVPDVGPRLLVGLPPVVPNERSVHR